MFCNERKLCALNVPWAIMGLLVLQKSGGPDGARAIFWTCFKVVRCTMIRNAWSHAKVNSRFTSGGGNDVKVHKMNMWLDCTYSNSKGCGALPASKYLQEYVRVCLKRFGLCKSLSYFHDVYKSLHLFSQQCYFDFPSPVSWVANSQGNGGIMWYWCIHR